MHPLKVTEGLAKSVGALLPLPLAESEGVPPPLMGGVEVTLCVAGREGKEEREGEGVGDEDRVGEGVTRALGEGVPLPL